MVKLINPAVAGVVASLALAALVLVVTTVFLVTAHKYSLSLPIIRVCLTVWSHIAVFMKRTPADVLRSFRVAAPVYVPTDYPPTSQQTKQFDLTTSPHVVQTQHSKSVQMISASTFAEVAGPVNYVHRTAFAVCDMCIRVLIRMCMPVHTHANAQTHKYMHTHTHTRHIDTHTSIHQCARIHTHQKTCM